MVIGEDPAAPHEAFALALNCDKAHQLLGWHPLWDFRETIARTVEWYARWLAGEVDLRAVTRAQIEDYRIAPCRAELDWREALAHLSTAPSAAAVGASAP